MSVAIVLPARLKSTRLPNKLLLSRTGKTLLEHSIERAKLAQAVNPKLFTTIRVACDDEQLIVAAKRAGVDAVMTDPNHQSGTDRIAEAARELREDVIVNLQADEPEIDIAFLKILATALVEQPAKGPRYSMATLATYLYDEALFKNPNVVKAVIAEDSERALYFSRAPVPYPRDGESGFTLKRRGSDGVERRVFGFHHIGMYAYRKEFLAQYVTLRPSRLEKIERLEQLRALENGYEIRVVLVDSHVPGIDTPEDYEAFVKRSVCSPGGSPGLTSVPGKE